MYYVIESFQSIISNYFFPSMCEHGCLIAEGGHASFVHQFQHIEIVFLLNFLEIKLGSPSGCFIRCLQEDAL